MQLHYRNPGRQTSGLSPVAQLPYHPSCPSDGLKCPVQEWLKALQCLLHPDPVSSMKEREKEGPEFAKYLPAINNLLVEDPKLVADAITVRCQPQCGHGVQETGCKGQGDRL